MIYLDHLDILTKLNLLHKTKQKLKLYFYSFEAASICFFFYFVIVNNVKLYIFVKNILMIF